MCIAENWSEVFSKFCTFLDKKFEIAHGGELTWYLHYERSKDWRFIVATQTPYMDRMLQMYSVKHSVKTPMEETFKVKSEDIREMQPRRITRVYQVSGTKRQSLRVLVALVCGNQSKI